jgi:hypothetical protein
MCIGFHSKETAKGPAISSLETRDLEATAHAPNYSPIKARSSRVFKLAIFVLAWGPKNRRIEVHVNEKRAKRFTEEGFPLNYIRPLRFQLASRSQT